MVDWYKEATLQGNRVLPPTVRLHVDDPTTPVIYDGTHRFVALWELCVYGDFVVPEFADAGTLTVAVSPQPFVPTLGQTLFDNIHQLCVI
ncbi:hypothetical protein H6764_00280 [Candidatus Nomurabacteria bacterium]|nr:hypothetical protein [Candidatus Nomurabacteria bacterium]